MTADQRAEIEDSLLEDGEAVAILHARRLLADNERLEKENAQLRAEVDRLTKLTDGSTYILPPMTIVNEPIRAVRTGLSNNSEPLADAIGAGQEGTQDGV